MEDTASLFWLNLTFNFREWQQLSPTQLALTFQRKTLPLKISFHAAIFLKLKNRNNLILPGILDVLEIGFRFLSNTGMFEVMAWSSSNETFDQEDENTLKTFQERSSGGRCSLRTSCIPQCTFFAGALRLKWKYFQKMHGPSEPTRPRAEQLGIPPATSRNVLFLAWTVLTGSSAGLRV